MKYAQSLCRYAIAGILLFVAVDHLINFDRFAASINRYEIVTASILFQSAAAVIIVMLTSGFGLFFQQTKVLSGWIAVVVFSSFTLALISAIIRGIDVECGCVLGARQVDIIAVLKPLSLAVACSVATKEQM